jgi:hypothetical protein
VGIKWTKGEDEDYRAVGGRLVLYKERPAFDMPWTLVANVAPFHVAHFRTKKDAQAFAEGMYDVFMSIAQEA